MNEEQRILLQEIEELKRIADLIIGFKTSLGSPIFNNASMAFMVAKDSYNDCMATNPAPTNETFLFTRNFYRDAFLNDGFPIKDFRDGTPLLRLIQHNVTAETLPMIRKLIEIGVDLNAQSQDKETPLSAAVTDNKIEIVRMLLEAGAQLKVDNTVSLIDIAAKNGNPEILKLLLDKTLERGEALHLDNAVIYAATAKNTAVMKLLIQYQANINAQGAFNRKTALHIAAQKGDLDMVNLLMTNHAKLDICDSKGNTPLHYAAMAGDDVLQKAPVLGGARTLTLSMFSNMSASAAELDEPNEQDWEREKQALGEKQNNYLNIARNLVDHGAPREMKNNEGKTPLALAIDCQRNNMADIISTDPDVNHSNNNSSGSTRNRF
jgi:ankyrin repeat protein